MKTSTAPDAVRRVVRRATGSALREPSPALRGALAGADCRLAAAPDPLARFTRERFEANRQACIADTLGVGPRLAPRR
jgi:hypothetical protein